MLSLLILGVVLLIVAYMVPMPPPLTILLKVLGIICVAIAAIIIVAGVLPVAGGTRFRWC